ncbi:MAG: hypothetical protein PHW41_10470, partial [Eubacteriales bacterium]|nr:hypothetical protein [Eubacteriales bacterium]
MEPTSAREDLPRPRFFRAVIAALTMSVVALLVWFLASKNANTIGFAILIATVILALLNWLFWALTRNAKHSVSVSIRILAAVLSLLTLLSVTIDTIAPTMLFYPHRDEESTQALAAYPSAEQLTIETSRRVVSGWMLHQ